MQQTTGPAKKAGIKGGDTQVPIGGADSLLLGGDVIVQIDGKTVKSMDDVISMVDSQEARRRGDVEAAARRARSER